MEKLESGFTKMVITALTVLSVGYATPVESTCNDGNGVYVAEMYFRCEYLLTYLEHDRIGIFNNSVEYCKKSTTDCCATCSSILSCQDQGILLAEEKYDCKYLLQDDPAFGRLGIYEDREDLCSKNNTKTDCCETCKKVIKEIQSGKVTGNVSTTAHPTTTRTAKTSPPRQQTTVSELHDECVDDCLHYADGTDGKCEWLLDPSRPIYDERVNICKNGFARGCKKTCRDVLMGAEGMISSRTTTRDEAIVTVTDSGCANTFDAHDGTSYECIQLVDPISDLFHVRVALCESYGHVCCQACKRVMEEASSNVVKYNEQNVVSDNGDVKVSIMKLDQSKSDSRSFPNKDKMSVSDIRGGSAIADELMTSENKKSIDSVEKTTDKESTRILEKSTDVNTDSARTAEDKIRPGAVFDQSAIKDMMKMISEHFKSAADAMFAMIQRLQTLRNR